MTAKLCISEDRVLLLCELHSASSKSKTILLLQMANGNWQRLDTLDEYEAVSIMALDSKIV